MKAEENAVSIRRYAGVLRRATYDAEFAPKESAGLPIWRALKRIAKKFVPFTRPVLRPLILLYYRAVNKLAAIAFIHRHVIRVGLRYIVPSGAALVQLAPRAALISLSRRLIELRIPLVSGLARRGVLAVLMFMLGTQMATGDIGRTLIVARIINLAFRPYIRARRLPVSFLYFQALFHARQYHRIVADVPREEDINDHYLNHILGVAHLYLGRPAIAIHYLKRAIALNDQHPLDQRMLGRAYLRLDDERAASRCFRAAVDLAPNTVMAHQNYAGRYDIPGYRPKEWELEHAESLLIYDNFGQLAEDLFLLGRFGESFQFYQKMLDYQDRIRAPLPAELMSRLTALDPRIDPRKPIQLLPYEWVTQFGHIGLLDSYIKMAELGMYPPANHVLLAPPEKVSNRDYLAYWDQYFTIVRNADLVDDLFPHQRAIGVNFMAYPGERGAAEPWTRAAARAHVGWARQGRPPLLKVSGDDMILGAKTLRALGIPEGSWYVGLHVREGGYYGEASGGMSMHRNAEVENYLPAIRAVTERGGYVIRLGDSSMQPLPDMHRVVDYAHSPEKSPGADIFFCGTSRFVIGTTSGLTTACLSFGTPMLLVNCISNDWQLWSGDTDFIVKPVWNIREKHHLSLAETFSPPVQGYLINADVMRRHGLEAVPNSADEIEAAVRYKLDLMEGLVVRPSDEEDPMRSYRMTMADNPMMFGAAYPVPAFIQKHWDLVQPTAPPLRERQKSLAL